MSMGRRITSPRFSPAPSANTLSRRALTAALLCCLALLTTARGEILIGTWTASDRSATVSAWSIMDELPPYGWIPVTVMISNTTDRTQQWALECTVKFHSGQRAQTSDSHNISLNGGTSQRVDLLVPAVFTFDGYAYSTLTLTGSSPQAGRIEFSTPLAWSPSNSRQSAARVAMSESSQRAFGAQLQAREDEQGRDLWLSRFNPARLPVNAMAWEGVNTFVFTGDEWDSLSAAARTAVLDRVAANAYLFILGNSNRLSHRNAPFINHPGESNDRRIRAFLDDRSEDTSRPDGYVWGSGSVFVAGAGDTAQWIALLTRFSRLKTHDPASQYSDKHSAKRLLAAVGQASIPVVMIMILLIAFGTVVGPLNLFVFARSSRRYRLFITTPLICLGAFIVTIIVILFRDGVGGSGERHALVTVLPEENRAVIRQEQVSRTGLLLNSSVPRPNGEGLIQLISSHDGSDFSGTLRQSPALLTGNWFSSRESQSHFITTSEASRAGLTWINASDKSAPPKLQSALPETAAPLYFHLGGTVWHAASVAPGETVELEAIDDAQWQQWLEATVEPFGPMLRSALLSAPQLNGYFFAVVAANDLAPRPSLESIRFTKESIIFTGAVRQP